MLPGKALYPCGQIRYNHIQYKNLYGCRHSATTLTCFYNHLPSTQCNHKFKGEQKCSTPHLTEDALKDYTIKALSFLLKDREALFDDVRLIMAALTEHTEIDVELQSITGLFSHSATVVKKRL